MEAFGAQYGNNIAVGCGISYNGEVIHTDYVGITEVGSQNQPNDDTILSVGSITKMFTSLMMDSLAEKGALKVTDPATKYFNDENKPAFKVVNPYNMKAGASSVTLESLSSQTSGLPRDLVSGFRKECTEEILMEEINSYPLYHQPLIRPHYSNPGFSLLGHCCERAARRFSDDDSITYESWLKDNVFTPWEMSSTGFDFTDEVKERMAAGYSVDASGQLVLSPTYATSLYWGNPAGGMYSTTADMMKFATHLLEKDGLLSKAGYEKYFMPGTILSDGVTSYGRAGWEIAFSDGHRVITKDGVINGFCNTLALVPELKLGVYFWANVQSTTSFLSAPAMNILIPAITSALLTMQAKPIPDVMDDIVGIYVSSNGDKALTISNDGDSMTTGIFYGSIGSNAVWFEFDEETTEAVRKDGKDDTYYFRYFQVVDTGSTLSCINLGMSGNDNGLVMFQPNGDTWTVSRYDYTLLATKKQ